MTLRANIIASGDTAARVVVSGTNTDEYGRALGRALTGETASSEDAPILKAISGRGVAAWQELVRFAAAIRGTP